MPNLHELENAMPVAPLKIIALPSAEKMGRAYRTAAVFRRENGAGCLRGLRKGNLRSEKVLSGQQPWKKILRPGIKIFFRRICVYNLPAACRY